jgi:hypothetical protein
MSRCLWVLRLWLIKLGCVRLRRGSNGEGWVPDLPILVFEAPLAKFIDSKSIESKIRNVKVSCFKGSSPWLCVVTKYKCLDHVDNQNHCDGNIPLIRYLLFRF